MSDGFETIYEDYAQQVYRYLLALSGSAGEAEELTQQTFYKALLHIGAFRNESSLFTWLCAIGRNEFYAEKKRQSRRAELSDETPAADDPAQAALIRLEAARARTALDGLDTERREVFMLRHYGGLRFSEIAARLNKSESWAKVTYYRARVTLMRLLDNKEETK